MSPTSYQAALPRGNRIQNLGDNGDSWQPIKQFADHLKPLTSHWDHELLLQFLQGGGCEPIQLTSRCKATARLARLAPSSTLIAKPMPSPTRASIEFLSPPLLISMSKPRRISSVSKRLTSHQLRVGLHGAHQALEVAAFQHQGGQTARPSDSMGAARWGRRSHLWR